MVWLALLTTKSLTTLVAALKLLSPAWEAVMVVVPAPTIVTVLPEIEATLVFELEYVTDKPEEAVPLKVNDASPKVLDGRALKLMVWFALAT